MSRPIQVFQIPIAGGPAEAVLAWVRLYDRFATRHIIGTICLVLMARLSQIVRSRGLRGIDVQVAILEESGGLKRVVTASIVGELTRHKRAIIRRFVTGEAEAFRQLSEDGVHVFWQITPRD